VSDPAPSTGIGRVRATIGLVAGLMILGSSVGHSIAGWRALRGSLEQARVPSDLMQGLHIGWQFAGAAMLTFGILLVWTYVDALRGRAVSFRVPYLASLMYLLFGMWSYSAAHDRFFLTVFVVPGVLLAVAARPSGRVPSTL
jgi:F0F1-type ATP synthase membrane subunit c/vacuolar-type H+-ATPase subunit K